MKIEFYNSFIKTFNKRFGGNSKIKNKFTERTTIFHINQTNPILKDHELKGKKTGLRAFSITGDIRVIYHIKNSTAYFLDIGTHNQVY